MLAHGFQWFLLLVCEEDLGGPDGDVGCLRNGERQGPLRPAMGPLLDTTRLDLASDASPSRGRDVDLVATFACTAVTAATGGPRRRGEPIGVRTPPGMGEETTLWRDRTGLPLGGLFCSMLGDLLTLTTDPDWCRLAELQQDPCIE